MGFSIIKGDITHQSVDAIVNAANTRLLGGSGVDGAIHAAAGPQLLEECRTLGGCETGKAKITDGYLLPARHVIHTPGPIWHGGRKGESLLLAGSYRNSLELAATWSCLTVAFPSISTGAYGYPVDKAALVAVSTILDFLPTHPEMNITMVCWTDEDKAAYEKAYKKVLKDREKKEPHRYD
ncbi:O-acetyl-ADP-ribose deacetylase [Parasphaerochaeta coccoides]|uniref:Appr-1-p processing domain protein n=1 Tax=Parasphaerochaeta coccoides (strain ATCC BAA-1237 / DSM 17374 / SPN1) TaxID=760011 RepID=F4GJU9_PARC1|nr:O-acetyl-ADP-ribose deacetylase [Parasphaerochaeta coccoides]AEC01374.1 Appr-1-p processing domain protein [Parasphaerochaeta coccoides DSM 17374]